MTASTEPPPGHPRDAATSTRPHPVRPGEILELSIDDLAREGRGVARASGLVLFVEGALPGERVRARVTGVRKTFAQAVTLAVLQPSARRVRPPCRHFGPCGGCDLQHLEVGAQGEAKRSQLQAAVQRIAGLAGVPIAPTAGGGAPYGYRFRMDFDWRPGPGGPILGLHRRHSADVIVPLQECHIAGEVTAAILAWAPGEAARRRLDAWDPRRRRGLLRRLTVQEARRTREVLVSIETGRGDPPELIAWAEALRRRFPRVVGVTRAAIGRDGRLVDTSILGGRDSLFEEVDGDRFRIPCDAFFQPNPEAGAVLRRHAVAALAPHAGRSLLELYGGVGFFTIAAARAGMQVTMVESVASACAAARENLAAHAGACRVIEGDSSALLPDLLARDWEAILVDPPRTGLAREVVAALAGTDRVDRLVYVSCDPGTLARDLGVLAPAGWQVREIRPFDLFPQTGHLEAVALLARN